MNKVNIISFIFIFICNINTVIAKEPLLKIKVNLIESDCLDTLRIRGVNYYPVHIEILNNTDSLVSFWTMERCWEMNWGSKNNELDIYLPGCETDGPILHQLKVGGSLSYYAKITKRKSHKFNKKHKFKLGFLFVKEKEVRNEFHFMLSDFIKVLYTKRIDPHDFIFSNSFLLMKEP